MRHYPIEIFWDDEDGAFVAIAPDLPGCSAVGDSEEEALRELRTAIKLWLDACAKAGDPIPEPSMPPGRHAASSGSRL